MFETTLVASRRQKVPRQRLLALPVAIAIHFLAVTIFVVGQLWATAPVPEPALMVSFYQAPPTPPPEARGTTRPPTPTSGDKQKPESEQAPTAVPEKAPDLLPAATTEPSSNRGDGVPGGVPSGTGTGVVGSVSDGRAEAAETPEIEERPQIIGGEIRSPILTHRVDPRYPEIARKAKLQGVVIINATIDKDGRIIDGQILRDIGLGCGEAALDAIRGWRYEPATLKGRAVSVYLTITVHFQLS